MRRTTTTVALAVAAALTLVSCGDAEQPTDDPVSPPATSDQAECGTRSPLTLTDSGWSALPGADNHVPISFAAVVTNDGDDTEAIAHNGTVTVRFLDDAGEEITDGTNPGQQVFDLAAVHPGEVRAVSGLALLTEEPATMEVEFPGACLIADQRLPIGEVTVTDVAVSNDAGELTVDLEIDSTLDEDVTGYPILVFRGTDSQIAGGGPYPGMSGLLPALGTIPPGQSAQQVVVNATDFLPDDPAVDLDATAVHILRAA